MNGRSPHGYPLGLPQQDLYQLDSSSGPYYPLLPVAVPSSLPKGLALGRLATHVLHRLLNVSLVLTITLDSCGSPTEVHFPAGCPFIPPQN